MPMYSSLFLLLAVVILSIFVVPPVCINCRSVMYCFRTYENKILDPEETRFYCESSGCDPRFHALLAADLNINVEFINWLSLVHYDWCLLASNACNQSGNISLPNNKYFMGIQVVVF